MHTPQAPSAVACHFAMRLLRNQAADRDFDRREGQLLTTRLVARQRQDSLAQRGDVPEEPLILS